MWQKILFVLTVCVFFSRPTLTFWENKDLFFEKGYQAQYVSFKRAYYTSQYVQKKNPGIIPDETLESFAGGAFLRGLNPILIVHDQPPLGRYITAASIALFDNSATGHFFALISSVIGLILLANLGIKSIKLSLIPVGLFINEPLFMSKITYAPLLEVLQLPFIVFAIYFFCKGIGAKKGLLWFILTSLTLGCIISIRFFILGGFLLGAFLTFLLLRRKADRLLTFAFTLPLSFVILFLSYTKTMLDGYYPWQIFGIQKYILAYHTSKFSLPFSFWDLLLFNRWHTWWGDKAVTSDSQWVIFWPISMGLSMIGFLGEILKKIQLSQTEQVVLLWVVSYSFLLSFGNTSTRYFLPLIPFLYISATGLLVKIVPLIIKREKT